MKIFGLIGSQIEHSNSPKLFEQLFLKYNIKDASYRLFPLNHIEQLRELLYEHPDLCGLNVTMPFKKTVIPFLDEISTIAKDTGAVNTIAVIRNDDNVKLKGFNTDVGAFHYALNPLLQSWHQSALILGNGGASAAVKVVCNRIAVDYTVVSRKTKQGVITYKDVTEEIIKEHLLIVNTTPLGMYPNTDNYPLIPYEYLTTRHLLFDMIYNPINTCFMKFGTERGAVVSNGQLMLELQAGRSLDTWRSSLYAF